MTRAYELTWQPKEQQASIMTYLFSHQKGRRGKSMSKSEQLESMSYLDTMNKSVHQECVLGECLM